MNSVILSVAILLALAVSSYGLVCPHNFCDNVDCAEVTAENCAGKIVKHGSTCGCCDSCRRILEPGANCFMLLIRGGSAPTVTCPDGYHCESASATCKPTEI